MDWQQVLVGAITLFVLGAFTRLAGRAPELGTAEVVLRYPRALRWFLAFGAVLFAAMLVAVAWPLVAGTATARDARTAGIGVPLGLVLAVGCFAEHRTALAVDRDGIGGRTAFRGRRRLAWGDVVEVRWNAGNHWFVLVDRHGEKLRVSRWLQGHAVLPVMLRANVPEPVWRDAVRAWERAVRTR